MGRNFRAGSQLIRAAARDRITFMQIAKHLDQIASSDSRSYLYPLGVLIAHPNHEGPLEIAGYGGGGNE